MVKAINKEGLVSNFSDTAWALLKDDKGRNGWKEIGSVGKTLTPKIIKEFQIKQAEKETTKDEPVDDEMQVMRDYLKEKGIKVSHLMGYDKLKKMYDDNQE